MDLLIKGFSIGHFSRRRLVPFIRRLSVEELQFDPHPRLSFSDVALDLYLFEIDQVLLL
jgi:hypothetical protein